MDVDILARTFSFGFFLIAVWGARFRSFFRPAWCFFLRLSFWASYCSFIDISFYIYIGYHRKHELNIISLLNRTLLKKDVGVPLSYRITRAHISPKKKNCHWRRNITRHTKGGGLVPSGTRELFPATNHPGQGSIATTTAVRNHHPPVAALWKKIR